jgi:hypothetical protein
VDDLILPLEKIIEKSTKDAETEKGNREMLKSTIRAIISINKIDDVRSISRKWNEFVEKHKKSPKTSELFLAFENETHDL